MRGKAPVAFSLVALSCAVGCAPPKVPAATDGIATSVPIAAPAPAPIATRATCAEPTSARDKGITALVHGRLRTAIDLLGTAKAADPRDQAAKVFLDAAMNALKAEHARMTDEQAAAPRVALEPIPLGYELRRAVPDVPVTKLQLRKESEAKNLITDLADWYEKNGLEPPPRRNEGLPPTVPPTFSKMPLRNVFTHPDHSIAVYGGHLVVSSDGKRPLVFDVRPAGARAPRPLEVAFAQLVGSTLLVELSYNGYAKESGGKNGYFAAYDATTGALRWASEPLVANVGSAVVSGGSIVTGYGFTAEPDFLITLDLATGKVDQKIALKSGPEVIRAKGDRLFVRSYDVDYVFKNASEVGRATPPMLEDAPSAAPTANAVEASCYALRGAASIAAKGANGVREAAAALASFDRPLSESLRSEAEHMASGDGLALTAAPLVVVPAPSWTATPRSATTTAPAPKLVKLSSAPASPTRNMHPTFSPAAPWFIAPVDNGKLPPGAWEQIPTVYGMDSLRAIIPDEEQASSKLILIYGGRYLGLVRGGKAERVFDLETLRHPPKADPQWKEFAVQDATYAQERDGTIYVCNGGGSYAKEVYGKKGFLTAIDATTGAVRWRSAPLTCNATFAVMGDYLVTGYGFTAEPDYVFLVRKSDGAILQKVPLDSGPDAITAIGKRVHVESYGSVSDFELR